MKVEKMQRASVFSNASLFLREALGWRNRDLARCYSSLRSLLDAGIAIRQAVEMCDFTGVLSGEEKARLVQSLLEGKTLHDSLEKFPTLPAVDRACLSAGEKSGHLPRVLSHLAQSHERWAKAKQKTISQFLYPVFLLHAAAFLLAVPDLVVGSGKDFVLQVAGNLGIIYAIAVLGLLFFRWIGTSSLARAFYATPVIGRFRRDLEMARFSMAFQHLYEAGVEIVESYQSACGSLQTPYYRTQLLAGTELLRRGEPLTTALRSAGVLHAIELQILETGEKTGTLGEAWGRLETMLRERGELGLGRFTFWLTQTVHLGALAWVGWRVISYYMNYYHQLNALTR